MEKKLYARSKMTGSIPTVPWGRAGPWGAWQVWCGTVTDVSGRRSELESNLRRVNDRIDSAMATCGRTDRPTLIVVTKFFPARDVLLLSELGVGDVGENRDQEAAAKAEEVSDPRLHWHFIGQLQTNKARSVAAYAHSVHSVDRASLVTALEKAMVRRAEHAGSAGEQAAGVHPNVLNCYVQVNLSDDDAGRGGARPCDVPDVAARIEDAAHLRLAGVMAVAPLGGDPREAFGRLAEISSDVVSRYPGATGISAGMSGDLEHAIAAGATHLRVGSDVLGARPPVG